MVVAFQWRKIYILVDLSGFKKGKGKKKVLGLPSVCYATGALQHTSLWNLWGPRFIWWGPFRSCSHCCLLICHWHHSHDAHTLIFCFVLVLCECYMLFHTVAAASSTAAFGLIAKWFQSWVELLNSTLCYLLLCAKHQGVWCNWRDASFHWVIASN